MNMSSGFVGCSSQPMSFEGRAAVKDKQKNGQKSLKSEGIRPGEVEKIQHKITPIQPYPLKKVEHVPSRITPTCLGK